jgi:hypothetical protein
MKSLKVEFVGERPILFHNGHLADPLNPYAKALKEVSGKRKKTDADHEQMGKIEWMGGLYLNADKKIIMPSMVIEAAIRSTAKQTKKGVLVQKALIVVDDVKIDLGFKYGGKNEPSLEDMRDSGDYTSREGVSVGNVTIFRTRPMFQTWSFVCDIEYDEGFLNKADIESFIENAYFGDWIPKYGLAHGKIV